MPTSIWMEGVSSNRMISDKCGMALSSHEEGDSWAGQTVGKMNIFRQTCSTHERVIGHTQHSTYTSTADLSRNCNKPEVWTTANDSKQQMILKMRNECWLIDLLKKMASYIVKNIYHMCKISNQYGNSFSFLVNEEDIRALFYVMSSLTTEANVYSITWRAPWSSCVIQPSEWWTRPLHANQSPDLWPWGHVEDHDSLEVPKQVYFTFHWPILEHASPLWEGLPKCLK